MTITPNEPGLAEMMSATGHELEQVFPDVDPSKIADRVRNAFAALTPAKVDTYLPVLVAHQVRDQLRAEGGRLAGAA